MKIFFYVLFVVFWILPWLVMKTVNKIELKC